MTVEGTAQRKNARGSSKRTTAKKATSAKKASPAKARNSGRPDEANRISSYNC